MILCFILLALSGYPARESGRDSLVVSLVTCFPGKEVYELCGHEAVRIRGIADGEAMDSVWNYGLFDFNAPNFVYRFVKGETDYVLGSYPFEWFVPGYVSQGRRIVEQELNLNQTEAKKLLGILRYEALPENRTYRYNYVKDNCATRILWRLDSAVQSPIFYPDTLKYGTFRKEMRAYHKLYPWYQFGIDLALGSGIDREERSRAEMFVPVEMMEKVQGGRMIDGRRLVSRTNVIYAGDERGELEPTPWYLTPLFWSIVIFGISAWTGWYEIRKKRIINAVNSVWFGICGLAGCVIAFLVFISEHEATTPNLLLLWLNPLQFIMAFFPLVRVLRRPAAWWATLNVIVLGFLLIGWNLQKQSANIAFFPLMGATLILSAAYAVTIYLENEKNSFNGANGLGDTQRGGTSGKRGSGTAKVSGRHRR